MIDELSIEEIELLIIKHDTFDFRKNLVVSNVSWGLLNHEADLILMSKSGYLTEIEIKRSKSDFLNDFKKKHSHNDDLVKFFFYAVPMHLKEFVINTLIEKQRPVNGIIFYHGDCIDIHYDKNIPLYKPKKPIKLNQDQQFQLARLGAMRVWRYKKKFIDLKNN